MRDKEKSVMTTHCYLEKDGKYLMLHRISKKNDVNKNKWIGIGAVSYTHLLAFIMQISSTAIGEEAL